MPQFTAKQVHDALAAIVPEWEAGLLAHASDTAPEHPNWGVAHSYAEGWFDVDLLDLLARLAWKRLAPDLTWWGDSADQRRLRGQVDRDVAKLVVGGVLVEHRIPTRWKERREARWAHRVNLDGSTNGDRGGRWYTTPRVHAVVEQMAVLREQVIANRETIRTLVTDIVLRHLGIETRVGVESRPNSFVGASIVLDAAQLSTLVRDNGHELPAPLTVNSDDARRLLLA